MEEFIMRIRRKAEEILNAKADTVEKLEGVPNNSVYKITADNKSYIFKHEIGM